MKKILFLILLLVIFSTPVISQSDRANKPKTEITVCKVELTEAGRRANFHFDYIYLLTTNAVGDVGRINQIHRDNPKFVKDEKFIACIKSWKLKPGYKYVVVISFGTNSMENLISISNEEERIKIIL